jgi:hypothetical protein
VVRAGQEPRGADDHPESERRLIPLRTDDIRRCGKHRHRIHLKADVRVEHRRVRIDRVRSWRLL